jgi:hypothetical protein
MKKIKLTFLFIGAFCFSSLQAQQAITTTGGNATGIGGSASYSVGQIVYKTNSGSLGSVSQGVQQPYEISVVSVFEEENGISLLLSSYPNPTTASLTLKVTNYNSENLNYQLYDGNGRTLVESKIYKAETVISMETFPVGIYFLKVSHGLIEMKTLKIIKNN